jgi:hypothetical protein
MAREALTSFENRSVRSAVRHVVLAVHGIGQRMGGRTVADDARDVRVGVNRMLDDFMPGEVGRGFVQVLPVQWRKNLDLEARAAPLCFSSGLGHAGMLLHAREKLQTDLCYRLDSSQCCFPCPCRQRVPRCKAPSPAAAMQADSVAEWIMPEGARSLRQLAHNTCVEVLLYMSPTHAQYIVDSVATNLNSAYLRFITYDLLAHQAIPEACPVSQALRQLIRRHDAVKARAEATEAAKQARAEAEARAEEEARRRSQDAQAAASAETAARAEEGEQEGEGVTHDPEAADGSAIGPSQDGTGQEQSAEGSRGGWNWRNLVSRAKPHIKVVNTRAEGGAAASQQGGDAAPEAAEQEASSSAQAEAGGGSTWSFSFPFRRRAIPDAEAAEGDAGTSAEAGGSAEAAAAAEPQSARSAAPSVWDSDAGSSTQASHHGAEGAPAEAGAECAAQEQADRSAPADNAAEQEAPIERAGAASETATPGASTPGGLAASDRQRTQSNPVPVDFSEAPAQAADIQSEGDLREAMLRKRVLELQEMLAAERRTTADLRRGAHTHSSEQTLVGTGVQGAAHGREGSAGAAQHSADAPAGVDAASADGDEERSPSGAGAALQQADEKVGAEHERTASALSDKLSRQLGAQASTRPEAAGEPGEEDEPGTMEQQTVELTRKLWPGSAIASLEGKHEVTLPTRHVRYPVRTAVPQF